MSSEKKRDSRMTDTMLQHPNLGTLKPIAARSARDLDGDLFSGHAVVLDQPFRFEAPRPGTSRLPTGAMVVSGQPAWNELYENLRGYRFAWGHILQAQGSETVYYFVPVGLIEQGVRTDALASLAAKWFEDQQDLFAQHISIADGPACVPLAIRAEGVQTAQWLAQVFLPRYFDQLVHIWREALGLPDKDARDVGNKFDPSGANIVTAMHLPIQQGQDQLQLVLVVNDPRARMCYVTWTRKNGLAVSDWIALPRSEDMFVLPTSDVILDFYRSNGYTLTEYRMPVHEPAIDNLVRCLIGVAAKESAIGD